MERETKGALFQKEGQEVRYEPSRDSQVERNSSIRGAGHRGQKRPSGAKS